MNNFSNFAIFGCAMFDLFIKKALKIKQNKNKLSKIVAK